MSRLTRFGLRYNGACEIAFWADGAKTGKFFNPGMISELTPVYESETEDVEETDYIDNGQVVFSASRNMPAKYRLVVKSLVIDSFELAVQGEKTQKSVSEAPFVDEPATFNINGSCRISKGLITNGTVTGTGGTPTYTEGTDFKLRTTRGYTLIQSVDGTSIADETVLEVSGTEGADAGWSIEGNKVLPGFIQFMFDGKSAYDQNRSASVVAEKARIRVVSANVLPVAGENQTVEFEITPVKDGTASSTHTYHLPA